MRRTVPVYGFMTATDANTHAFVIRIWAEGISEEEGLLLWRGHVTHVESGERKHVHDLDGILDFITVYLNELERGASSRS